MFCKKKNILVTLLLISMLLFTGCGQTSNNVVTDKKFQVVCTIFPEYDWVREVIAGREDDYELTMLLDSGADLHNYQATAEDIAKIANCDLFIYVGGPSDVWVEDVLTQAVQNDVRVINLLEMLGDNVKAEEMVEGMEHSHETHEKDVHGEEEHTGEEHSQEVDEHVWLSLQNAQIVVDKIATELSEIDSENAEIYMANAESYIGKLTSLDSEYQSITVNAKQKTILFGERFPFRYLVDDYGIEYYAAFNGCSAETEASFETIIFLAGKMDELGLKHIFVVENSDQKIANTIVENTQEKNQEILTLNSLQSVKKQDVENGVTYLQVMEDNLETLKKALQ